MSGKLSRLQAERVLEWTLNEPFEAAVRVTFDFDSLDGPNGALESLRAASAMMIREDCVALRLWPAHAEGRYTVPKGSTVDDVASELMVELMGLVATIGVSVRKVSEFEVATTAIPAAELTDGMLRTDPETGVVWRYNADSGSANPEAIIKPDPVK